MKVTRGIEKEGNERALRHFELARNALEMRFYIGSVLLE
jgi:hypothetical protein